MQGISTLHLLAVGAGGFIGSVLRFLVYMGYQRFLPQLGLPLGTLTVNVLGCLAIGYIGGLVELKNSFDPATRLFLIAGLLGGFTTFSAYAFEALTLGQYGMYAKAGGLLLAQVVLGFGAAWLGFQLAR
jgi:CrcB protein